MTASTDNSGLKLLSRETGSPAVDLSAVVLPLHVLDSVREETARRLKVLPLRVDEGQLFVAAVDPNDTQGLGEIAFLAGRNVVAYAAPAAVLERSIDEAYAARKRGEIEWRGELAQHGIVLPQPTPPLRQPDVAVSPPVVREPFFGAEAAYVPPPPTGPGPGEASRRPRVLVVDDEPVITRIVRHALGARGYEIIEAHSGLEALRLIKERDPDVLLLDAMLPDVHGFDICKRLKESRRYRHIPVVMMTAVYKGWRMAADLRESYGVAGFIEKPFDIHEIVRQIEGALAGRPPQAPDMQALSAEAQRLYDEGSKAYRRGDLDAAVNALLAAVAIDPLNATLRHQLGLLHAQRGQDYAAIQELEMAVDLEPDRFALLRNLAILYQRRGFRRKACELWERALSHAPDEPTRHEIKNLLVQLL